MKLLLFSDIFGKTDAFIALGESFKETYDSVLLVDPYQGEVSFSAEHEAYSYFQKQIGLEKYSKQIRDVLLAEKNRAYHAVGFSVGASALWLNADKLVFHHQSRLIGFYGSQIRNSFQLRPKVQFDLYFPEYEEHYEVSDVMVKLAKSKAVNCYQTKYLHGFMNKESINYNEEGYREYSQMVKKMVDK